MDLIKLKNISPTGAPLIATFLPEGGMNLCSYKLGSIEVIDQKTLPLYEERRAGLGALIGPHFHERGDVSTGFDESLFPHIAKGKAKGRKDPFSHGIARYVPWKYVASDTQIKGRLRGDDLYKGVPLKVFEGQNFSMTFEARLLPDGLFIEYRVDSENPSLVGLHYYYAFSGKGTIHGAVQPTYRKKDEWKPLPKEWSNGKENHLHFLLPQDADFGFLPAKKTPNDHDYHIILDTEGYSLHIDYNTASDTEISCQVYHPKDDTFVCIEPLSAKSPSQPKLHRNILEAKLEIFSPLHTNKD
ncbi:MAG: hypothetical protein KFB93_07925 [Simkaniaceae bacterium]|nr:MAG: hypothetical protein KFB93_07925 [Simkaniaceae bacterium]